MLIITGLQCSLNDACNAKLLKEERLNIESEFTTNAALLCVTV